MLAVPKPRPFNAIVSRRVVIETCSEAYLDRVAALIAKTIGMDLVAACAASVGCKFSVAITATSRT